MRASGQRACRQQSSRRLGGACSAALAARIAAAAAAAASAPLHRSAAAPTLPPRDARAAAAAGSQQARDPAPLALSGARQRLLLLLDAAASSGSGLYYEGPAAAEVAAAVEALIAENPSLTPGLDTPAIGGGTWEVFYAPHIARMSSSLGTRFEPIRYTLQPGGAFSSNVRFSSPLLGSGWLSAAGSLSAEDEGAVRVDFKEFWVDRGDRLRAAAPAGGSGGEGLPGWVDPLVESIGRAAFLPQLSVFPVLYLDAAPDCQLAVFKFPPLDSNIAVRRVGPA